MVSLLLDIDEASAKVSSVKRAPTVKFLSSELFLNLGAMEALISKCLRLTKKIVIITLGTVAEDSIILAAINWEEQACEDGGYRFFCSFSNERERNFELFTVELDTQSSYTSDCHGENEKEYILVFDGELILETDNKKYILNSGDSIVFDASKTHIYINNSLQSASILKFSLPLYYSHCVHP